MSILIILFGSDKYNASVVVGYTSGGKLVFYDMIDLNPANFIIKNRNKISAEEHGKFENQSDNQNPMRLSTDEDSISQNDNAVNTYSMQDADKNSQNTDASRNMIEVEEDSSKENFGTYDSVKAKEIDKRDRRIKELETQLENAHMQLLYNEGKGIDTDATLKISEEIIKNYSSDISKVKLHRDITAFFRSGLF